MKKLQILLFALAVLVATTAAIAAKRAPAVIYVQGADGNYYKSVYHPSFCVYNAGTYCFYGSSNTNLGKKLTPAQLNAYLASGVVTAHNFDRKYQPL